MKKNLVPIGNSLGVVIERPILDLLGIGRDTQLNILTDGRRLILEPLSHKGDWPPDEGISGGTSQDFGDPGISVRLVEALVSRFHMDNRLFRRLHHARNYDNTFKAHRDWCAKHPGRFQPGGTNEMTARRLHECLTALEQGHGWDVAIDIATNRFPR